MLLLLLLLLFNIWFEQISTSAEERVYTTRLQFEAFELGFANHDELYPDPYKVAINNDTNTLDELDYHLRFGDSVLEENDKLKSIY
jgi:hypothetical protein